MTLMSGRGAHLAWWLEDPFYRSEGDQFAVAYPDPRDIASSCVVPVRPLTRWPVEDSAKLACETAITCTSMARTCEEFRSWSRGCCCGRRSNRTSARQSSSAIISRVMARNSVGRRPSSALRALVPRSGQPVSQRPIPPNGSRSSALLAPEKRFRSRSRLPRQ